MSVSKWAYSPEKCDGQPCVGDCNTCSKAGVLTYEKVLEAFRALGKNEITPEWIIVPDDKKEWWQNLLKEHGITSIKVMPESYFIRSKDGTQYNKIEFIMGGDAKE